MNWPERIAERIARQGAVMRVTVIRAEGSTPREIGAAMLVGAGGIEDTIGGGALEQQATAHALGLLAETDARMLLVAADAALWHRECRDFVLGPSLGQCCGGAVRLLFESFTRREWAALADIGRFAEPHSVVVLRPVTAGTPLQTSDEGRPGPGWPASVSRVLRDWREGGAAAGPMLLPGRKAEPDWFVEPLASAALPLVLHGAGHVGRALVRALEGLPFRVTWVDARPDGFPATIAPGIVVRHVADPAALMKTLPERAIHLVMTHSHPLDLAICHAVLREDNFRFLGLIGSQTKRARFLKRLRELGIAETQLSRLVCPIGLPGIDGKHPAVIAVAVAAQLLQVASEGSRPSEGSR